VATRVLIVDDEPLARERLRFLLRTDPEVEVVGECGNGKSAIQDIRRLKPALVFLDVEMPELDGFGVLRALNELPTIVFVTAHQHYAIPAFEARALDYLLKPFSKTRFFDVLARAKAHVERNMEDGNRQLKEVLNQLLTERQQPELLIIKSEGRLIFLKTFEVRWIEAEKDYVKVHLAKTTHLVRETMSNIQRRLDPDTFMRIHRSAIVNAKYIREIQPLLGGHHNVVLYDEQELTLSRRYRAAIDRLLRKNRIALPRSV
jgi:two-component system LytT family response regulator